MTSLPSLSRSSKVPAGGAETENDILEFAFPHGPGLEFANEWHSSDTWKVKKKGWKGFSQGTFRQTLSRLQTRRLQQLSGKLTCFSAVGNLNVK